jgi:hypothetical protein
MAICDTCGNDYDKAFTVTWGDGEGATFDVNDRYPVPAGG